jgi:glycosyltransferase involved in cell wall biosynthesis
MSLGNRKRILFISHESSLTGAPVLLMNLLRLLKERNLFDFEILLVRGGPLEKDFKSLAKTDVLKSKSYATEKRFFYRAKNYILYLWKVRKWRKYAKNFDLIFSNTITNGRLLSKINARRLPVIVYVHELESGIHTYLPDAHLSLRFADKIAVPSEAVARNLVQNHSVSKGKIFNLNYFFPFTAVQQAKDKARFEIMKQYSVNGKFLIASMGTATHRKGFDLFMEVCNLLKRDPEIFFFWIGDFVDQKMKSKFKEYIERNGLSTRIIVTGFIPYSFSNLLPFDLFLLTSREDPYPLVVLEAAFNKLPSISFESGGITEFISKDAGWIIPGFSVNLMAEKIKELKKNLSMVSKVGAVAFEKAEQLHANEETVILQLGMLLNEV